MLKHILTGCLLVNCLLSPKTMHAKTPFDAPIRKERPRIFIRTDNTFEGLTVSKLRAAFTRAEFKPFLGKLHRKPMGRAILWLLNGKDADLKEAVRGLEKLTIRSGSWSDRGLSLMQAAALFDWLYNELDPETRTRTIAKIEAAADDAASHITRGRAPFFYSRTPGALAGVALSGIALKGANSKADQYIDLVRTWGVNDFFRAYEWVDGAATGATYTLFYTYVHLPALCSAWWSATGTNPAPWIERNQGDWLNELVEFMVWYMKPGFAFTDINDLYRPIWSSHDQFCQGLDIASYVTGNGCGRSWSLRWLGRCGSSLYHTEYAHNVIFRAAAPAPQPLTDLPHAQLFGRDSCGYGFFRSSWPKPGEPDTATHVFFRAGDPMNVHGGVAAGEFQLFKYAPLAARSGKYRSYDSPPDQYHRNAISTNVVLFTDPGKPDDRGDQYTRRGLKSDHKTWNQWLEMRKRYGHDVARILYWKVSDTEARCRADLSKTNPGSKCRNWIREWIWCADRHLIVLDYVERTKPEINCSWQLHLPEPPTFGDHLITMENRMPDLNWADRSLDPGKKRARLFFTTLLPQNYTVTLHSGGKAEAFSSDGKSKGGIPGNPYHLKYGSHVLQIDPGNESRIIVFLNVLTAVDEKVRKPPQISLNRIHKKILNVTIDGKTTTCSLP